MICSAQISTVESTSCVMISSRVMLRCSGAPNSGSPLSRCMSFRRRNDIRFGITYSKNRNAVSCSSSSAWSHALRRCTYDAELICLSSSVCR